MTDLFKKGQEDVYVSGNPSSSFFRSVYKSSGSYSYTLREFPIDNEIFMFPKDSGEFVSKFYIKIIVESGNFSSLSNPTSIYKLIEFAELYIGSQVVQVMSGEFMYNYMYLNSGINEIESLIKNTIIQNKTYTENIFLYVPIPFYFSADIAKSLPLYALHKSHVYVRIRMFYPNPLYEIVNILNKSAILYFINTTDTTKPKSLDYIITQVQCLSDNTIDSSEHVQDFNLPFLNHVRELFICVYEKENLTAMKNNFTYVNKGAGQENNWLTYASHLSHVELFLNGVTYIDSRELMLHSMLPDMYYSYPIDFIVRRGFVYPLCMNPNNAYNTGSLNMSRIRDKNLRLHFKKCAGQRSMRIYAVSYNILRIRDGISGLMFTSYDNNTFHLKF